MKHCLLLFLLFSLSFGSFAQMKTIDLGRIYHSTVRYADVRIGNHSEESMYVVKIENSPEIVCLVDKEYVRPDSSFILRVQVNPDTTGHFNYLVRVFLSGDELPVEMRVVGEVIEMPDYTDFQDKGLGDFYRSDKEKQAELTITTVDAVTGFPISSSTVTIIDDGIHSESWLTGSGGAFRRKMDVGFLYFVVSKDGYETTETGIYLTPDLETVYIPLKREAGEPAPMEVKGDRELAEEPVQIPKEEMEKTLKEQIEPEASVAPEVATFDNLDFSDTTYFRPVNVFFILDLSGSMRNGEKMNLMKYSLNQLAEQLREQDKMAMITYSSGADMYLSPTSGSDKGVIAAKIKDLKADNRASGTRGLKLGYKKLAKMMEPNAANMIVIMTDGAFNNYSGSYQRMVKKYAKKGITFSVIGIKDRLSDEKQLKEAAALGKGRYVSIDKLSDAQMNLVKEIRMGAYRK